MLQAIRNYFRRRKQSTDRALFRFFDGQRMRAVDPIEVQIALDLHETLNLDDYPLLQGDDPQTMVNFGKGICDAFGVLPWDEATQTGMSLGERIALLEDYWDYCEALKKNTSDGLTSPPPLESIGSSNAPADPQPTTNSSAVYGSTSIAAS